MPRTDLQNLNALPFFKLKERAKEQGLNDSEADNYATAAFDVMRELIAIGIKLDFPDEFIMKSRKVAHTSDTWKP